VIINGRTRKIIPEENTSRDKILEDDTSRDKIPEDDTSRDKIPEENTSRDKIPADINSKVRKSTTIRLSNIGRDRLSSTVAIMNSVDNNMSEFHDKRRKNEVKIQEKINFLERKIAKFEQQKREAQESLKNMKRLLEKSQDVYSGSSFVCVIQ